jgi:hypothetical protein
LLGLDKICGSRVVEPVQDVRGAAQRVADVEQAGNQVRAVRCGAVR